MRLEHCAEEPFTQMQGVHGYHLRGWDNGVARQTSGDVRMPTCRYGHGWPEGAV